MAEGRRFLVLQYDNKRGVHFVHKNVVEVNTKQFMSKVFFWKNVTRLPFMRKITEDTNYSFARDFPFVTFCEEKNELLEYNWFLVEHEMHTSESIVYQVYLLVSDKYIFDPYDKNARLYTSWSKRKIIKAVLIPFMREEEEAAKEGNFNVNKKT